MEASTTPVPYPVPEIDFQQPVHSLAALLRTMLEIETEKNWNIRNAAATRLNECMNECLPDLLFQATLDTTPALRDQLMSASYKEARAAIDKFYSTHAVIRQHYSGLINHLISPRTNHSKYGSRIYTAQVDACYMPHRVVAMTKWPWALTQALPKSLWESTVEGYKRYPTTTILPDDGALLSDEWLLEACDSKKDNYAKLESVMRLRWPSGADEVWLFLNPDSHYNVYEVSSAGFRSCKVEETFLPAKSGKYSTKPNSNGWWTGSGWCREDEYSIFCQLEGTSAGTCWIDPQLIKCLVELKKDDTTLIRLTSNDDGVISEGHYRNLYIWKPKKDSGWLVTRLQNLKRLIERGATPPEQGLWLNATLERMINGQLRLIPSFKKGRSALVVMKMQNEELTTTITGKRAQILYSRQILTSSQTDHKAPSILWIEEGGYIQTRYQRISFLSGKINTVSLKQEANPEDDEDRDFLILNPSRNTWVKKEWR